MISEDTVPTTVLRHAQFQWAITKGAVAELRNVRLPLGHLAAYCLSSRSTLDPSRAAPVLEARSIALHAVWGLKVIASTRPVLVRRLGVALQQEFEPCRHLSVASHRDQMHAVKSLGLVDLFDVIAGDVYARAAILVELADDRRRDR